MKAPPRDPDALTRPYPLAARPGKSAVARLLVVLRPYRGLLAIAVLLGVLHQILVLAAAGTSARMVGLATVGEGGQVPGLLAALAAFVVLAALLAWIRLYFEYELAHRILAELRIWLFSAFERLLPGSLPGLRSGELVATGTADIARVDWFFARFLPSVATAVLVPAITLVVFFRWHPLLGWGLLPLALAAIVVPFVFRRRALEQGDALRAAQAGMHAEVLDGITGLREILALGQGEAFLRRLDELSRRWRGAQLRYGLREGAELAIGGALTAGGMSLALVLATRLVSTGELEPALLPVVVLLASAFFGPILAATGAAARLGLVGTSAQRVFALLEKRARVEDGQDARVPVEDLVPHLVFEDVHFTYEAGRPEVLRGVSFAVRPGEKVALVGASGAGKSTCMHLLLRFFDPASGRILLGGHDLRELPLEWLRGQIAWVPQDAHLFDESVEENLRLADPEASREEIEAAARAAQVHELIASWPEGYKTRVGERGTQLSGGQRQRLLIARALLKNAPIWLMDEAVSNLDGDNEKAVHEALRRLGAGRTVLLVAHRLQTIRSADRIVVLENGRVAEVGDHDSLVAAGGAYTRWVAEAS